LDVKGRSETVLAGPEVHVLETNTWGVVGNSWEGKEVGTNLEGKTLALSPKNPNIAESSSHREPMETGAL